MNPEQRQRRNWLSRNRSFVRCERKTKRFLALCFSFAVLTGSSQIANYVTNGSFEQSYGCNWPNSINWAKGWRTIDSSNFGIAAFYSTCYPTVPSGGMTYQWPRTGSNYGLATFLCQPPQCPANANRGYYRNRLKANLQAGTTYCVKFYVNISNPTSYGIDAVGAFFVDNSIDTITKCVTPLTYIVPQVQNPVGNILSDTLNWVLITGTFVANGSEKNVVIGNFKSDAATNKVLINPTILPTIGADVLLDDVSCIPIDLPAYAHVGPDIWAIPGSTVYIGRPQDVGIDEACEWFKLPNTTSVIANSAGLTLTVAATTETYMVKQDICGVIKYDTVVIHSSLTGNVTLSGVEEQIKIYPIPANEQITIECNLPEDYKTKLLLQNSLGQIIREEEITFENFKSSITVKDLDEGIYILTLSPKDFLMNKRFVITR